MFFTAAAFIHLALSGRRPPENAVRGAADADWWSAATQFIGTVLFNIRTATRDHVRPGIDARVPDVRSRVTEPIRIDVWSDIACPWCYIGKRNLETGIAQVAEDGDAPEVQVVFHSYELSPDTPEDFDGGEVQYLTAHRGVSEEQAQQMLDRVGAMAADAGLEYRFDILRHTNTLKAHELLHFAREQGRQGDVAERLMAAYFTEGRHLGRIEELATLAGEAGLDATAAAEALRSGRFAPDVAADKAQAVAYGITAVPFFVIDEKYGVAGAQPADGFAQILRRVRDERSDEVVAPA